MFNRKAIDMAVVNGDCRKRLAAISDPTRRQILHRRPRSSAKTSAGASGNPLNQIQRKHSSMSDNNDFSHGSVPRHILSLAVPMTLGQLVQIAYNLVDRIYIGHMEGTSSMALTGLGLTFPIVTIIMAFTNLFGTGGVPLFSIARGKRNAEAENRYMENTFLMLCISSVAIMLLCYLFMKPVLYLFGASDESYPYSAEYLKIYLIGTPFVMLSTGMNGFINAQGFGKTGMFTILFGAVANIILDPIFIFAFDMGIAGAAIATVLSQLLSAVWVLLFLTGKRALRRLRIRKARLHGATILEIMRLGVAGFIMQASNGAVQIAANNTLGAYGGDIYIGVMTVLNSVREVVLLPMQGLSNAAQPVIGYNLGAQKYDRIKAAIRFTTPISAVYAALCWLLIFLFPEPIMQLFNADPELLEKGAPAMHIFFFGFFMMAFHSVGQCVFVGLGKSRQAVCFSLLRKIIVVVPLTLLLPHIGGLGVTGVFVAEPISNFVSGVACFATMLWTVRRLTTADNRAGA